MEVKIKTNTISIGIIAVLIGVLGVLLFQMYMPKSNMTADIVQNVQNENIFEGKVTNVKVTPGRVVGFTTYDANCIGDTITQCDAGIDTSEYGELNFHYSHNMATKPCLHMFGQEKVIVDILNEQGDAKVIRTIDTRGMMH